MMHADKNAKCHVLDQNVDRISREITYVPLNGRIRSKRSSCMWPFFFFFFLKKMSTRHAYQWSDGFEVLDMLPRGPMDLKFGRASQRLDGLILDVLPRGPLKLNLDVLPRGLLKLNFGCASQRFDGLKFWTCFPEVRWFEFGRASQRSDGFEIWTCFPEVH